PAWGGPARLRRRGRCFEERTAVCAKGLRQGDHGRPRRGLRPGFQPAALPNRQGHALGKILLTQAGGLKGLWYSVNDVGPEHIRGIITFGELSRSPVEEHAPAA